MIDSARRFVRKSDGTKAERMMDNKEAITFFSNLAQGDVAPQDVKVTKNAGSDFTQLDADFIMRFASASSSVLDLGAGSGLIVNKIADQVNQVTAVEKFESFSQFIKKSDNIKVVNCDILEYAPQELFDLVTIFGVAQYFNRAEITGLYGRIRHWLASGGLLIVKNQFGVREDVLVNGFSEELETYYSSHYRHIDAEVELLESLGFKIEAVHDIYPPECNRW